MNSIIKSIEAESQEKRNSLPDFSTGDTINVHVKIKEGNKERVQQYQGVVIQRKNSGTNGETFTVRKISNGIAVERIFPSTSPTIDKVELLRKGSVRRARLYYLRDKTGKGARIKESRKGYNPEAK
ncbi:MAG TPA: 50S ribosomal protein L19 [Cytophagaceae bacterium]|jgi:large subunit ribosomal protein L19|nr:50S ribosomal protein L19 [Cytophagaceae bacterium]